MVDLARKRSAGGGQKMRQALRYCVLGIVIAAWALAASAQQPATPSPTLDKLRQSGTIYLGYRESALPFSYLDERQNVQGYTWDVCAEVLTAIKSKLELPQLQAIPVPVSPNNRLLMVRTGMVDLDCGASVNTPSRQRQVSFSHTLFVSSVRVMVTADSTIKDLAELDRQRVVSVTGSTAERLLKTSASLRGVEIDFVLAANASEAMDLLRTGKADAVALDEVLLATLRANAANPAQYRLLEDRLAFEPYALVMTRNDPEFKALVDVTLAGLMLSGRMAEIYDKWFVAPLPSGIKLDLPLSPILKGLFANPNDRAG